MRKLPDISDYYTGDRAVNEEVSWILTQQHQPYLDFLKPKIQEYGIKTIVEAGCRSGHVAVGLPDGVQYLGIDRNAYFLKLARIRCRDKDACVFALDDIRTVGDLMLPADLVISFAFLKHFSLEEWDAVLAKVLSLGRFACIGHQLAAEDFDDGTEFHHSFVTEERLRRVVEAAGHRVIERVTLQRWTLPERGTAWSELMWSERTTDERSNAGGGAGAVTEGS